MSLEAQGSLPFGVSGKFALEGNRGVSPAYDFLKKLGITTGIVIIGKIATNGHAASITWTGTGMDIGELTRESVIGAGGTGCLEIKEGQGLTTVFISSGQIVSETIEPKEIDSRQGRMAI